MGLIDNGVKWIANHLIIAIIIMGVFLIIVVGLALSPPGQALWKLLVEQPIFFFIFGAAIAGYPILYWIMLRPMSADALRKEAWETWDAARRTGFGKVYKLTHFEQVRFATDPANGIIFSGKLFENAPACSVKISDKPATLGRIMRRWDKVLSDEEIEKHFKKSLSLDEKLVLGKQAEAELDRVVKKGEEQEAVWGPAATSGAST